MVDLAGGLVRSYGWMVDMAGDLVRSYGYMVDIGVVYVSYMWRICDVYVSYMWLYVSYMWIYVRVCNYMVDICICGLYVRICNYMFYNAVFDMLCASQIIFGKISQLEMLFRFWGFLCGRIIFCI